MRLAFVRFNIKKVIDEMYWVIHYKIDWQCYHRQRQWKKMYIYMYNRRHSRPVLQRMRDWQ